MKTWICKYCGKDTKWIDMDYLVGTDHLQCVLEAIDEVKQSKGMKIKNWDKIYGYSYKGYCIVNPVYSANGNNYYADVLNLNLSQKPTLKLELSLDKNNMLILTDTNGLAVQHLIELVDIRTAALFRVRYEEIIDEMVSRHLASAPTYNSHSINIAYSKPINTNLYGTINVLSGSSNGILNTITTNANTITWNPTTHTNLPSEMIYAISELQKQIDDLKVKHNG